MRPEQFMIKILLIFKIANYDLKVAISFNKFVRQFICRVKGLMIIFGWEFKK